MVEPAAVLSSAPRWDRSLAGVVVDALPLGVVVVSRSGQVLVSNPMARDMGVIAEGDRLALKALIDLVGSCAQDMAPNELEVALPVPIEAPLRRPRPDREQPVVKVTALKVDADAILLLLEDLTEQRRVDAVRRDFVANVSHELKTPVGAMHLLAEAIAQSSDDEVTVRRFADRMATESRRLGNLVQELIDLSRVQGAEPLVEVEDLSVATIVAEAIDRVRTAAGSKEIEIATIGDFEPTVAGDLRQLAMAVSNLLDNAVTYSPEKTRVVVGVRRDGINWIEITVRDEGIGISLAHQERVFERFFRVDPARSRLTGGTGLGLAIVKYVATNHGGSVSVWSAGSAGSTFTLRLPTRINPRSLS